METIAALKKGNTLVFNEVYYAYHKKIYFFILQRTRSAFLAEETTQLTFIKCWKYRETLSDNLDIQVQLFRIARTTLIDLLRKDNVYEEKVIHVMGSYTVPSDEVWEKLAEKELRDRLAHALESMPPMRRKVFEMSRYKGMSYQQIARELSLSSRTVEAHIFQAVKQLKHSMGLHLLLVLAALPACC